MALFLAAARCEFFDYLSFNQTYLQVRGFSEFGDSALAGTTCSDSGDFRKIQLVVIADPSLPVLAVERGLNNYNKVFGAYMSIL